MRRPQPTNDFSTAARFVAECLPDMSVPEMAARGIDTTGILAYDKDEWSKAGIANCYGFGSNLRAVGDPGDSFFFFRNEASSAAFKATFMRAAKGGDKTFAHFTRMVQGGLQGDHWKPVITPEDFQPKGRLIAVFTGNDVITRNNAKSHDYHVYGLRRINQEFVWMYQPGFAPIDIRKCLPAKYLTKTAAEDVFDDARSYGYTIFAGLWQKPY